MKKRIYFFVFTLLLLGATASIKAQGLENFNNSNATSSYADGSFVGENGITWTYVASRDANGDANGSGIALPALMLRRVSDVSSVTSSTISGGIGDFSVKLYKGFTGGGDRQVELFINDVSYGTSTIFDDFSEHIFSVTGINVTGDIVIRLDNITAKQIIVDDISWTAAVTGGGLENFNNSNATSSYADGSFVGEGGISWTYVASRDANGDANGSGIALPALMLRRVSDVSSVTSSTITGGIGDFSVKLYKGFTGGGDRQVELFINDVSYGTSTVFDDFSEHIFSVSGINVSGDIVIRLDNITAKQIIVDDISWTASGSGGDTTPPEVTDGNFPSATSFWVAFSEPVTQASAENTSNYVITPGITVTGATLNATQDTVFGTITPGLVIGTEYTVDITGVIDTSANANEMVPFSISLYFNDYNGTDLIVSEISYAQPSNGIQDIDYFEVYNKGATDINMAGMYFTQGVNLDINTSLVVAAGEYFVFCEQIDSFNLAFPAVINVMQWESGSLSGGGEDIEITNSIGEQVLYVDYETNSAPWPSYSDTTSHELCDLASDYTIGSNWRHAGVVASNVAATIYGSPGSANSCVAPPPVTDVATMADLRAGAMDGTLYRLTGEVVITYARSSRNQKYIQDATGAILIDDSPGVITTAYVRDDGMTNLVGSLGEYNGVMQFNPYLDPGAPSSTGNVVTPEVVALGELKSNFENYESELILVNDVNFSDAGAVFASGNNYEIVQAPDTGIFRTIFSEADYIGGNIPAMANVTSLAAEFNGTAQIVARDAADFELPPTSMITFRVDMNQSGQDLSQGVNLMGTVTDWDPGIAMDDTDGDLVYELTLDLVPGDYQYKFKTGTGNWENLDGEIFPDGNRALTVAAGEDQVLEFCWESTEMCSDVATSITFKVDMNFSGLDLSQGVNLMGTVTDWGTGAAMDDTDGDLVYELTLDLQPNTYLYKFKTGAGTWESTANRQVTVIDGETQMLPAVCWESLDLCPYPAVTITAPDEGSVSTSADVTVEFMVDNWVVGNPGDPGVEGHIHWMLDGASQPMKFDLDPIDLMGLADGDHTVILKLVDNDHVEIGASDTVNFSVNTVIIGGGMETFTNSNATSTYADGSYVGDNGITWNYVHSRDDNGDANGSGIAVPALMLRRNDEPSSVFSESIPDGVGNFSVKLYKGFTGGGNRQVEVFINDVSYGVSVPFDDFEEHIFTVDGINVPGDVVIRIDNITPKQVIVDDISWTGFQGEAVPGLSITSPTEGSTSEFADVTVNFAVQNFVVGNPGDPGVEGHIHWSLDAVDQPLKFDTDPIQLIGLADGGHTVIMKLVDNNHVDLDPPVADTVNFIVATPDIVDVATIADLRAGSMDGTVYRLTGEAFITYEQSFRGQKYIQDATAAILIDDPNGVITTEYIREDGMTNVTGTLDEFGGVMEFVPFMDPGAPSSTGNVVTPEVVTLAELQANFENYESELILVLEVTFDDGGTALLEAGMNYDITDPSGTGIFRTSFFGVDYIGEFIPVLASNITCLALEFNGTSQIVARDLADFDFIDAVNEIDKANFSFYPNPNNGEFTLINDGNTGEYLVELINLTGKVIYSENITLNNNEKHVVSSGDVVSGVYLVKLTNTQDSYSRTLRMIVK